MNAAKKIVLDIMRKAKLSKERVGIVCPCGLGDTYLACSFIKAYQEQSLKKPILIIKNSHIDIVDMFQNGKLERYIVSNDEMSHLIDFFISNPKSDFMIYGHISFYWNDYLFNNKYIKEIQYNEFESVVTKMYRTCVFKLKNNTELDRPNNIHKIDKSFYLSKYNIIQDKSIILFPEANSINEISFEFWNNIASLLRCLGFKVFFNLSKNKEAYYGDQIDIPLRDLIGVAELCGYIISLRSGISDILSTCNANNIVIYSDGVLLSTGDWSLKKMGLTDNVNEIYVTEKDCKTSYGEVVLKPPMIGDLEELYSVLMKFGIKGVTKTYLKFIFNRIKEKLKNA